MLTLWEKQENLVKNVNKMDTCIIHPCRKNSKGEIEGSRLFEGLLSMFPKNRKEAWRHYKIATSEKFLNAFSDRIVLDDLGEVSIQTYLELMGMTENDFPTEQLLNKQLKAGKYSYQEAIEKVSAFNRGRAEGSKYIATIRPTEDRNLFEISIAQDTELERNAIEETIRKRNLQERLISILAKNGVAVNFVDGDSRYSTENADRNINGLFQLIEFSKTGKISDYFEEAGHLVIGAMGNEPLVLRLQEMLKDEKTRNAIIGKEGQKQDLGDKPWREAAGIAVGKALKAELDDGPIKKLVSRLINRAINIFAKMTNNEVLQAMQEAKDIAASFASDFIQDKIPDAEKKAMQTVETLYHKARKEANTSMQSNHVTQILEQLNSIAKELKATGHKSTAEKVDKVLQDAASKSQVAESQFFGAYAVIEMIPDLAALLREVVETAELDNSSASANTPISFDLPPLEASQRLQEEAHRIMSYSIIIRRFQDIAQLINTHHEQRTLLDIASRDLNIPENSEKKKKLQSDLSLLLDTQNSFLAEVRNAYQKRAGNIAASFLQHIYGARFVSYNAGLIWDFGRHKSRQSTQHKQYNIGDLSSLGDISFNKNAVNIVEHVEEDDSMLHAILGSLVDSKDIGGQLIVKAIKKAKQIALQEMGNAANELQTLREQGIKRGIKTYDKFFTRNENGELTGYLLYPHVLTSGETVYLDWAKFEQSRKQMVSDLYAQYLKSDDAANYENAAPIVQRLMWQQWLKSHPTYKEWYKNNASFLPDGRVIPSSDIYAMPGVSLTADEKAWYAEYHKLFDKYKYWLGESKMHPALAPQARGTALNSISNLKGYTAAKAGKAVWNMVLDTLFSPFTRVSEKLDESRYNNWNSEETADDDADLVDDFLSQPYANPVASRILPIYHTRRLKDTNRLDTDLISSTLKFACMAANYKACRTIQEPLEVTADKLVSRTLYTPDAKNLNRGTGIKQGDAIRVNQMIQEYIDANFYGINYGFLTKYLPKLENNMLIKGAFNAAGQAMTVWYLGGNLLSAAVNAGTGFLEIFKEAITGEDFKAGAFLKSISLYSVSGIPLILDGIFDTNLLKINKFVDEFNATDKTADKYKTWTPGVGRPLRKWLHPVRLAMSPYAISEHFMQAVPYMAMAMNTTLYYVGEEGEIIKSSLWKELKETNNTYSYEDKTVPSANSSLRLTRMVFTSEENVDKYARTKKIRDLLNDPKVTMNDIVHTLGLGSTNDSDKTITGKEFENEEGWTASKLRMYTPKEFRDYLDSRLEALQYNKQNLADFAIKAREVTNRMHGVYNKLDKTAFHRTLLGMLLLPFKGYVFGMIQKRFGAAHYNVALGHESEGYYRTLAKKTGSSIQDIGEAMSNLVHGLVEKDPVERKELFSDTRDLLKSAFWTTGMNTTQNKNLARAALTHSFIIALKYLVAYAKCMAMGEDDDEYIDQLSDVQSILNYAIEQDYDLNTTDEKEYSDNEFIIDLSVETLEKIESKIRSENRTSNLSDSELSTIIYDAMIEHARNELKRANKASAQINRPWWNRAYVIGTRVAREQAAFDTPKGFKTEGGSVVDVVPLSFRATMEIIEVLSSLRVGNAFSRTFIDHKQEIDLHAVNFYLGGNRRNRITVAEAAEIINTPTDELHMRLGDAREDFPKKEIHLIKKRLREAISNKWEQNYPRRKMDKYLYPKSKKGHHKRYEPKGPIILENKLKPWKRWEYISSQGDQVVRDYTYGR